MNRHPLLRCMDAFPQLVSFWRASRARTSVPSLLLVVFFSVWLSVMSLFAGGFVWGTPVQAAALSASLPVVAQTPSAPVATGPASVPAPAYTSTLSRWHVKKGTPADVRHVTAQNLVGNTNQSKVHSTGAQPNATFPEYYVPVGLGEHGDYTFGYKRNLTDRESIEVNAANGNLIFHASGFNLQGTGLNFSLDSFYNSQEIYDTEVGQNWTFSNATGIYLLYNGDGSVIFHGPTDTWNVFPAKSGGGFTSAPGLNATLVANSNGTHTLTFHKTGEVLSFDSNGFMTTDQDKNGNKLTFVYNSPGSIDKITDTQGRVLTITHNATGKATLVSDTTGRAIKYTYDANDLMTSMTDLDGKTTSFTYQGAPAGSDQVKADLATITDPAGHVTTIGYNDIDQVTSIKDASGATTTLTYTTGSKPTTVLKDANGKSTTYAIDSSNVNHVLSSTDALGHARSSTYDSQDNVISSTDALANKSSFTFNATTNNLTSVTDSTGVSTGFSYSDTTHPYYPTSQTDTQGNQTAYTYTPAGNVSTASSGKGLSQTQKYSYNGNGTVSSATDANGNQTTYSYDSKGNLTTITPKAPLGQQTLTYDANSRVTSLTDGIGKKTSYTYDRDDRITLVTYADGSTLTYTYDSIGNITSVTDRTGTTTFSYDKDNRETLKTLPGGIPITSTYDAVGNLLTLSDSGGTTTYHYNAVNLSDSLTEPGGAKTTFSYNANNSKTGISYPNGVSMALSYDNAGRETGIVAKNSGGTVLTSYTYSYVNPATNKLTDQRYTMTDTAGTVTKYTYDASNQLTNAAVSDTTNTQTGNYAYTYDANGNRLTSQNTLNGPTTTYSYNVANELTSSSLSGTTTSYSYDGNGNQTASSAGLSVNYNVANQATTMNGTTNTYSGADQSQRVKSGATTAVYTQLGLASEATAGGTTYYIRCSCSALAGERTPTGTYYYLFDGLGSIVGLTDSSGNLVNTYQYDPYGNLTNSTGSVSNPWRYAGGYYDSGTGLYKFGIRYYDPVTGRWTQSDPVGGSTQEMTKANPYVYADNNPASEVDPSGRAPSFWDLYGTCISSGLSAALAVIGGGIALISSVCGLTGVTCPFWLGPIAIGTAIGIAVGLLVGCAVFATVGLIWQAQHHVS